MVLCAWWKALDDVTGGSSEDVRYRCARGRYEKRLLAMLPQTSQLVMVRLAYCNICLITSWGGGAITSRCTPLQPFAISVDPDTEVPYAQCSIRA